MSADAANDASVTAEEAKERFAEVLDRAARSKERVIVTQGGKALAALVPVEDLNFLEELEDRLDAEDFQAAREEWIRNGRGSKSLDQIVRELKLKLCRMAHAVEFSSSADCDFKSLPPDAKNRVTKALCGLAKGPRRGSNVKKPRAPGPLTRRDGGVPAATPGPCRPGTPGAERIFRLRHRPRPAGG